MRIGYLKIKMKKKPKGQVAVVVLLFLLVALTIGLSVVQQSLTHITTSTQSEQGSRSFSAAEAGIEKSLGDTTQIVGPPPSPVSVPQSDLGNQARANVQIVNNLPATGVALEYPPIGREDIAQFWLADPKNPDNDWQPGRLPGDSKFAYGGSTFNVYFGDIASFGSSDSPALAVNLITKDGAGNYKSSSGFYDSSSSRAASNGFASATSCAPDANNPIRIITSSSVTINQDSPTKFLCYATVSLPAGSIPILTRVRILYSNIKQPVALQPVQPDGGCSACTLPRQAAIYTSVGYSGQTTKIIQVFRQLDFVPTFLDFAIFSSGQIEKNLQ